MIWGWILRDPWLCKNRLVRWCIGIREGIREFRRGRRAIHESGFLAPMTAIVEALHLVVNQADDVRQPCTLQPTTPVYETKDADGWY